jgi:PilZ domain
MSPPAAQPLSDSASSLAAERRAWPRHGCLPGALVYCFAPPDAVGEVAALLDLSAGGARLALGRRLAVGTPLLLRLGRRQPFTRPAEVVHASRQATGLWHLGCKFAAALTDAQLRQALADAGPPPE